MCSVVPSGRHLSAAEPVDQTFPRSSLNSSIEHAINASLNERKSFFAISPKKILDPRGPRSLGVSASFVKYSAVRSAMVEKASGKSTKLMGSDDPNLSDIEIASIARISGPRTAVFPSAAEIQESCLSSNHFKSICSTIYLQHTNNRQSRPSQALTPEWTRRLLQAKVAFAHRSKFPVASLRPVAPTSPS